MENEKLKEILKLHEMWLNNQDGGQRADLRNADLRDADLSGANLIDADLRYANLSGANLSYANLSYADLCYADLSNANLSGADLIGANIRGANLIGANLIGAAIPMFCKWWTGIVDDKIKIGCKVKSIEEWEEFLNSDEVIQTPRNTPEFKQIEAMIRAYIAYLTTLNK